MKSPYAFSEHSRAHGQSGGTGEKEGQIRGLLHYHLRREIKRRSLFSYIDLNAGPGFNDAIGGVVGSPIAAVRCAQENPGFPFHMNLIDKSQEALDRLRRNIANKIGQQSLFDAGWIHPTYWRGDNEDLIKLVPGWVLEHDHDLSEAAGWILSDPNGTNNGAVSIKALSEVLQELPRFAFAHHFNRGAAMRVRGSHLARPDLGCSYPRAADYLLLRQHWLVGEPWGDPRREHFCLAGFDKPTRDWKTQDGQWLWHYTDSPRGREILEWADEEPFKWRGSSNGTP